MFIIYFKWLQWQHSANTIQAEQQAEKNKRNKCIYVQRSDYTSWHQLQIAFIIFFSFSSGVCWCTYDLIMWKLIGALECTTMHNDIRHSDIRASHNKMLDTYICGCGAVLMRFTADFIIIICIYCLVSSFPRRYSLQTLECSVYRNTQSSFGCMMLKCSHLYVRRYILCSYIYLNHFAQIRFTHRCVYWNNNTLCSGDDIYQFVIQSDSVLRCVHVQIAIAHRISWAMWIQCI